MSDWTKGTVAEKVAALMAAPGPDFGPAMFAARIHEAIEAHTAGVARERDEARTNVGNLQAQVARLLAERDAALAQRYEALRAEAAATRLYTASIYNRDTALAEIERLRVERPTLAKRAYEVCLAIEECGASEKLTAAVILASALRESLGPMFLTEKDKLPANCSGCRTPAGHVHYPDCPEKIKVPAPDWVERELRKIEGQIAELRIFVGAEKKP